MYFFCSWKNETNCRCCCFFILLFVFYWPDAAVSVNNGTFTWGTDTEPTLKKWVFFCCSLCQPANHNSEPLISADLDVCWKLLALLSENPKHIGSLNLCCNDTWDTIMLSGKDMYWPNICRNTVQLNSVCYILRKAFVFFLIQKMVCTCYLHHIHPIYYEIMPLGNLIPNHSNH